MSFKEEPTVANDGSATSLSLALPGVMLTLFNLGVLITGASNSGKSELALTLLQRGHRLIADDVVQLLKRPEQKLEASCPPLLQDFLALTDIGIINVKKLFGLTAIQASNTLDLIIHLETSPTAAGSGRVKLDASATTCSILGEEIVSYTLYHVGQRPLVALVETIVLDHQLKLAGYIASAELIARQQQQMLGK